MMNLNKKWIIIGMTTVTLTVVPMLFLALGNKPQGDNSVASIEQSQAAEQSEVTSTPDTGKVNADTDNKNSDTTAKKDSTQNETAFNTSGGSDANVTQASSPSPNAAGTESPTTPSATPAPGSTPDQDSQTPASPLIGRCSIIKTVKLKQGQIPVIDPVLNVNILGFEKGTGTVQMATFGDSVAGKTVSNPVIVPDGKPDEAVYVSFYRMQDMQESFIGKHVVWYNSIVSTAKTFPVNYRDPSGSFGTKNNDIYLVDYIYVK